MDNNKRIKAEEFFHKPPVNYGCSQAVLLGFKDEFNVTESDIAEFALYRGGNAPEGCCGALYAANVLLKRRGLAPVSEEFCAVAGSTLCREIKFGTKYPCLDCVRLADTLLEKRLAEAAK